MKITYVMAYVKVVVSGLVIGAAAVLVILQWGNTSAFSLYGKNLSGVNTGGLMLCSAAAWPVLIWMGRVLIGAARSIHRIRSSKRFR